MKTSCPHCFARYALPDARVAGKVLRIRCKRCQGVMKVVGPTMDAQIRPPTMTGMQAYRPAQTVTRLAVGQSKEWFAGIAGTPHGPYSGDQLQELCRRGDIHDRTYLWTRGMSNWERICASPRLGFALEWVLDGPRTLASLEPEGGAWRPEPTNHTGWVVVEERMQAYLETAAKQGAAEELGFQAAMALGAAGLSLAVGAAIWLSALGSAALA